MVKAKQKFDFMNNKSRHVSREKEFKPIGQTLKTRTFGEYLSANSSLEDESDKILV